MNVVFADTSNKHDDDNNKGTVHHHLQLLTLNSFSLLFEL